MKSNKSEIREVIEWLQEHFSNAFPKKNADAKPLQLGIIDDIMDFYDRLAYPPFSKKRLRAAINFYTGSKAYLLCQIEGADRVNIYGQPVETVTQEQAQYAVERYQTMHSKPNSTNSSPPPKKSVSSE